MAARKPPHSVRSQRIERGKVKRGAANLLGGRAVRYELHGLTANENDPIGRRQNYLILLVFLEPPVGFEPTTC